MKPQVLAVIPARGGSKSTPRKNIKALGGIPLIAYSVAAGKQSQHVTRVIVSTDDREIAEIASAYGAEVPFLRPGELAQDDTLDFPVFRHALEWMNENEDYQPEIVVQLRPTSPFRPKDCVDRAVEILLNNAAADAVRTVIPSGQNPYKMWRISPTGSMRPLMAGEFDQPYNMPRQQLPATYWQTGHVDAARSSTILKKQSMTGDVIHPLILDPAYTVDIDTPLDFERAEWMLAHSGLDLIRPKDVANADEQETAHLASLRLLVLDFDGVLTDNRVLVSQDGTEAVWCNRSDGWGIARLKGAGLQVMVLSTEANEVVAARCQKLQIPCVQACDDKLTALKAIALQHSVTKEQVAYVGNDVNDFDCMRWVGMPIAVADAMPEVRKIAKLITSAPGGKGAVREVCEKILSQQKKHNYA